MKLAIIVITLSVLYSCSNSETQADQDDTVIIKKDTNKVDSTTTESNISDADVYTYEAIFSMENGWGYNILNQGELYISQPHIPAVSGNKGFDTEEKANTTAAFIVIKLNKGIFPPTISPEELDSLGVL